MIWILWGMLLIAGVVLFLLAELYLTWTLFSNFFSDMNAYKYDRDV